MDPEIPPLALTQADNAGRPAAVAKKVVKPSGGKGAKGAKHSAARGSKHTEANHAEAEEDECSIAGGGGRQVAEEQGAGNQEIESRRVETRGAGAEELKGKECMHKVGAEADTSSEGCWSVRAEGPGSGSFARTNAGCSSLEDANGDDDGPSVGEFGCAGSEESPEEKGSGGSEAVFGAGTLEASVGATGSDSGMAGDVDFGYWGSGGPGLLTRESLVRLLLRQLSEQKKADAAAAEISETEDLLQRLELDGTSQPAVGPQPVASGQSQEETEESEESEGEGKQGAHNAAQQAVQAVAKNPSGLPEAGLEMWETARVEKDLAELMSQLRRWVSGEDRVHMGRLYLQSFIAEDALSFFARHADPTELLFFSTPTNLEPVHTDQPKPAMGPNSPLLSPSPRSGMSAASRSPRSTASAGSSKQRGIGRAAALWVANELCRRGEWHLLSGDDGKKEGAVKRNTNAAQGSTGQADRWETSPWGIPYQPLPALLSFSLFRMRTATGLNEVVKWPHSKARSPVAVSCHLLHLLSQLHLTDSASIHDPMEVDWERDSQGRRSSTSRAGSSYAGSAADAEEALEAQLSRFEAAAAELQAVDCSSLTSNSLVSFLINLHNLMVVHGHVRLRTGHKVGDEDRRGFMKAVTYRVGPFHWSLLDVNLMLRTRLLRTGRVTPLIHLTLSFGSVSSPNIRYYLPQGFHHQLEAAAREYCASVKASASHRKVLMPFGFKFFAADFARTRRGLVEYVAKFAPPAEQAELKGILSCQGETIEIRYMTPNWSLALHSRLAPLRQTMSFPS